MELLRATVPPEARPMPVGRYLLGPLQLSGTLVKRLKAAEGIRVNGTHVWANHLVHPGDEIVLVLPPREAPNVDPEPVPIVVAYEDADLIVLDKPAGLVVHPTKGCYHGTLANGLAYYLRERGEPSRIHPVHRIDRDTSGLVVFAKHPLAHQRLADQLEQHKLARHYLALVWGVPAEAAGVITQPIALVAGHPVAREVDEAGQAAETAYEVLERFGGPSPRGSALVRLRLATGRTHQIRVHMAAIGHPLVGDALYGELNEQVLSRQALHAASLAFSHPRSEAWCCFESPLPADMAELIAHLRG